MKTGHTFITGVLGLSLLLTIVGGQANSYSADSIGTQSLDEGLVAYYPFNGNADDESGNMHHGIEYGGIDYTTEVIGQAARFDGVDDYIITSEFAQPEEALTICAFALPDLDSPIAGSTRVVSTPPDCTQYGCGFDFKLDRTTMIFAALTSGGGVGLHITASLTETHHCLCTTFSGDSIKGYIDGSLAGEEEGNFGTIVYADNVTSIRIGRGSGSPISYKGLLDEVRIYDRVLTEPEIRSLCANERIYLPLVVHGYETFPLHIGYAVTARAANYTGEVFYTTSLHIPATLPSDGHFYLSSQPGTLTEVLVDDEIAILWEGIEILTYDFSTSGLPQPAIIEIPRPTMEQLAEQTITVEYRDVYGSIVQASAIWLIWTP